MLLARIAQVDTLLKKAWLYGRYETYRLNFELPAVRLHRFTGDRHAPRIPGQPKSHGCWFAVDEYHALITDFTRRLAVPRRTLKLKDATHAEQDIYLLLPSSIVNVGIAAPWYHWENWGGGLQFELMKGSAMPVFLEHARISKHVQF